MVKLSNFKITLVILALLVSSCQKVEDRLSKNIFNFLNENEQVFNDYQPVKFELVDTLREYHFYDVDTLTDDQVYIDTVPGVADPLELFKSTATHEKDFSERIYEAAVEIRVFHGSYSDFIHHLLLDKDFGLKVYKQFYDLSEGDLRDSKDEFISKLNVSLSRKNIIKGYIYLHSYRTRIQGENVLHKEKFFLDKNYRIICRQKLE